MACIELVSQWGTRLVEENAPYQRLEGEEISRVVWDCGNPALIVADEVAVNLERAGIQWGDAIAWTTKKLGIAQCKPCAARQAILNNVKSVGWIETIRQLKETF